MRIILVSCFLLSTCSLSLSTEYVEGVYVQQPSKKEKRFIFNKTTNIQRLIQGLAAFSSISNSNSNKDVPIPAPATTTPAPTTAKPTTVKPTGSAITLAIPPYPTSTAAPQKDNNDFDQELDYLTQYRDNAYALPESGSGLTQPKYDRLPPLPQKLDTDEKTLLSPQVYSQTYYTSPHQLTSAGLTLGTADTIPLTYSHSGLYSQPLPYLSAHQTQLSLLPHSTQTYLPQQYVVPAPQISPLTYQTHQQSHLSYETPIQASIPSTYSQHQSYSNNHFSFSNNLPHSAHSQTAYYGNTHNTDTDCNCKGYK